MRMHPPTAQPHQHQQPHRRVAYTAAQGFQAHQHQEPHHQVVTHPQHRHMAGIPGWRWKRILALTFSASVFRQSLVERKALAQQAALQPASAREMKAAVWTIQPRALMSLWLRMPLWMAGSLLHGICGMATRGGRIFG